MIESSIQAPEMHHPEKAKRVARSRKSSKDIKVKDYAFLNGRRLL
jgi:hypothetical protein